MNLTHRLTHVHLSDSETRRWRPKVIDDLGHTHTKKKYNCLYFKRHKSTNTVSEGFPLYGVCFFLDNGQVNTLNPLVHPYVWRGTITFIRVSTSMVSTSSYTVLFHTTGETISAREVSPVSFSLTLSFLLSFSSLPHVFPHSLHFTHLSRNSSFPPSSLMLTRNFYPHKMKTKKRLNTEPRILKHTKGIGKASAGNSWRPKWRTGEGSASGSLAVDYRQ